MWLLMWFKMGSAGKSLKRFQIRRTSAEDDDVTSIRFSARKAKTAAARTGDSSKRRGGLNRNKQNKKGHKKHDGRYWQQSPGSRILEFDPRESAAGQWTDTQRRRAQST